MKTISASRFAGYAIKLARQVDWAEVYALSLKLIKILIVTTLLAGMLTRRLWDALPGWSEALGRWYSARLVGTPAAPAPPLLPAAAPAIALLPPVRSLERAARAIVPAIALAFIAGFALGVLVHQLNDALAGRRPVAALPSAPAPVALEALTCRELRELVGTRRKLAKRELIAMALRGSA